MGHNAEKQVLREKTAHIHSEWLHKGKFISLRKDEIDFPDGHHKTWDIVVHPGAVAIVPLTESGKIILVEQFRRAIGRVMLEIPAGLLDPGETEAMCAQRELQEETGYRAGRLIPWGTYYPSPGVSTEKLDLLLGDDLVKSELFADDTDEIDVHMVSVDEALALIENGTICDTKTIVGIFKLVRN